jgi:hypothetical protein
MSNSDSAMRTATPTTTTTTTNQTTQQSVTAAYQPTVRCTVVPKGHCVAFSYQPSRAISIAL